MNAGVSLIKVITTREEHQVKEEPARGKQVSATAVGVGGLNAHQVRK